MKVCSVVIHHETKNKPYFDLTMKSLAAQIGVEHEVIVSCTTEAPLDFPDECKGMIDKGTIKVLHLPHSTSPEVALNMGFKMADPTSEHYIMLNDDVILSKYALHTMSETIGDNTKLILNAWSNCDTGWLYFGCPNVEKNGKRLRFAKQMRLSQIEGFEQELINIPKLNPVVVEVPFLCFYATMMHRDLFKSVGGNDERFHTGQSDQFFCLKARRDFDAKCRVTFETFIFHFGGVTVESRFTDETRMKSELNYRSILQQEGFSVQ